jgi:uncharacterized protein (DUF1800 family)
MHHTAVPATPPRPARHVRPANALAGMALVLFTACTVVDGDGSPPVGHGLGGPVASVPADWGTSLPAEKQAPPADVARFLSQATFGPVSTDEVAAVQRVGYEQWIDRQMALPVPSHLDYVRTPWLTDDQGRPREEASYEAIWQHWLFGEDQLRARVVFALSQIFVVSNVAPDLNPLAMSSYMDMLNRNAFGNWRTLMEEVTLHPAMGYYLNMLGSEKEDLATGRLPNENYAREILQLFSIGLVHLNRDGTPKLDAAGQPQPTYDESVVLGFAKAFSGWSFGGRDTTNAKQFGSNDGDWTVPMQAWPSKHSGSTKLLLSGRTLPAGQSAQKDMTDALDAIFTHPNVAPFFARRLIQRLVTSNPSPAYIDRVATAFENNGAGVRGDLKAVVRAVLLDAEARDATVAASAVSGKQREPVIRFANLLRATGARSASGVNGIHALDSGEYGLGQSPLLAPSVFNFFSPDFEPPGPVADAGLVAPEFQITTETTVVGTLNFLASLIGNKGFGSGDKRLDLDFSGLEALSADPPRLVSWIDTMFMNGAVSASTRDTMTKIIASVPATSKSDRVKVALLLTVIAPEFVIQR